MVYKRIKRGAEGAVAKKGGPSGQGKFKQTKKIGEATAQRMQAKLGKMKKDDEDEIVSRDSEDFLNKETGNPSHAKRKELMNDPFLQVDEDMAQETIEEKRLKMANNIIAEYAKEEKTDFFD